MNKRPVKQCFAALFVCIALFQRFGFASRNQLDSNEPKRYEALIQGQVDRARTDLERVEKLVEDGALPKVKIAEAKLRLADLEDEAILARTLYGRKTAEDMTAEDADQMLKAAQRRVERSRAAVEQRQGLLASGAIARLDLETAENDLEDKKRVLKLAEDRIQLIKELSAMAETERQLARSGQGGAEGLKESMIRYDGNGAFTLNDLTTIEAQFQKKFHHELPVSARGQTLMHQSLGLDHRNRVDIALNPDQTEGVWLRALLERLHVPYLAFRTAVAGAATAPHIHVGVGSTRLKPDIRQRG